MVCAPADAERRCGVCSGKALGSSPLGHHDLRPNGDVAKEKKMPHNMRNFGGLLLALVLVFNLGCAQTQEFVQADSARVAQKEKENFSFDPHGAGQETDWQLYMDMEGGD
jgi:hypothetical protein